MIQTTPGQEYKLPTSQFSILFFVIMSKSMMLSLLAQGNTGNEIMSILDALVADQCAEVSVNEPTADVIDF